MGALLVFLSVTAVLFGLGFSLKVLWYVAFFMLIVWLVGFAVRDPERNWYRW